MANPTRKKRTLRQRSPDEIPRRPRAACDDVLADFLRDDTGRRSLEAIRLWHCSAVLLEKRAAGIIGKWAYDQFERAAKVHDLATFQMLIAQQMEPLAVTPKTKFHPLHAAARMGFEKGILLLLAAGADIDAANYLGWRALHAALHNSRGDIATLLLSRGASVRPPAGRSSLMTTIASMPGLTSDLLAPLICRHSGAAPVADQLAEAKQTAEIYGNASVIGELDRLAVEEAKRTTEETAAT